MPLSLVTAPVGEPLTWALVQKQIQQDGSEDDAEYVTNMVIPAVRDRGELATRRAFLTQTWQLVLDEFPSDGYIEIPKPPLVSVGFVRYVDTGGVTRTMTLNTDYLVQAPAGPRCRRGRIALPFASVWPITLRQMGAVTVQFTCGYGSDATAVPPLLIAAMLTDAGKLYENRESVVVDSRAVAVEVPGTAQDIYRSYCSHATQSLGR